MKLWDLLMLKLRKEFTDHIADGHPFGSDVPTGAVIAWFSIDIPDGWAWCDGAGGTIDLREKFLFGSPVIDIVGAGGDVCAPGNDKQLIYCNWIQKL